MYGNVIKRPASAPEDDDADEAELVLEQLALQNGADSSGAQPESAALESVSS